MPRRQGHPLRERQDEWHCTIAHHISTRTVTLSSGTTAQNVEAAAHSNHHASRQAGVHGFGMIAHCSCCSAAADAPMRFQNVSAGVVDSTEVPSIPFHISKTGRATNLINPHCAIERGSRRNAKIIHIIVETSASLHYQPASLHDAALPQASAPASLQVRPS
jgi:hypothetical protein